MMERRSTGLVLAGAAALGAYEAGVLDHVLGPVARDVGRPRPFDVVSGTSAGAINAAAIAAFADEPAAGAQRSCEAWSSLRLGRILRPSAVALLCAAMQHSDRPAQWCRALGVRGARGGLLDPRPIESLLTAALPMDRIETHLASGVLRGVAFSATHVATGRAAVFYRAAANIPGWGADGVIAMQTRLGIEHAMASAAIPILLPPVAIDGDLYCDGGLRQMVPLSPSIHLGARHLLVIDPLAPAGDATEEQARREASTSPFYLAGKALNALFVDRTAADLERLDQLSTILRTGREIYGESFEETMNARLARTSHGPLHDVTTFRIEPSRDLGRLAADYAASGELARREHGLIAHLMQCLAVSGPTRAGDLLSYLMFDGGFAAELIELGRADARHRHAELCAWLASCGSADRAEAESTLVAG